MKQLIKRVISIVALTTIYSVSLVVAKLGLVIPKNKKRYARVVINGTFHNPNWFHAHIEPTTKSGYGEIVLVTDEPLEDLPNLIYSCPPKYLQKILTRAGAKFIWTIKEGLSSKVDIFIGYHIFPSAITALIAAKLLGSKCCYQVTSGPLELQGGGFGAENKLLSSLSYHSEIINYLVNKVVRCFDLVVVRGSTAHKYIREIGYNGMLEIITGSVLTSVDLINDEKDIDVILLGRLSEYKRPELFVDIIKDVLTTIPDIKVKIVGDGPLKKVLEDKVIENNLSLNIEFLGQRKDVSDLLGRSKIFVLTSRWEGVSIAMLEAMALKVVPIVLDVGDLKDYVFNESTGFIVSENQKEKISNIIIKVLRDDKLRNKLSNSAREIVMKSADREVLSIRWKKVIDSVVMKDIELNKK